MNTRLRNSIVEGAQPAAQARPIRCARHRATAEMPSRRKRGGGRGVARRQHA